MVHRARRRIPLAPTLVLASALMVMQTAAAATAAAPMRAASAAAGKASGVAVKVERAVKRGASAAGTAVESGVKKAGAAVSSTAKKLGLPTQPASGATHHNNPRQP